MEDERTEITEEENDLPFDAEEADPEWDDIKWGSDTSDTGDESADESEEADQPEEDKSEEETPAESEKEPEPDAEDADQWLELKHMDDEPRKVSKEEAKALAQKGLDYDRIRQERDDLKAKLPRYEEMEKFLQEMQGDFATLEDFMDDTRARVRADAEGISYDDALAAVKSSRKPAEPQPKDDGDRINVNGFVAKYPTVKAEEIPESVWADVRSTGDLLVSYEKYDNNRKADRIAELEKEIETLKNNKKNADRSTGSSRSSGASNSKSLIASLWDDGD